jgi:formiminotetrahydrofolate cyclodeaminase
MEILRLARDLTGKTSAMLASDLAIAAVLAEAGARAAAWNVRINLPLLDDQAVRETFERTMAQTLSDAAHITREIETACAQT